MMKTVVFPKIEAVKALPGKRLMVHFVGGECKTYDCHPLLNQEPFSALQNESLFRQVKVDVGGYGVSWSDSIDLSESELWLNGETGSCTARSCTMDSRMGEAFRRVHRGRC
jgi:hypothetical protein